MCKNLPRIKHFLELLINYLFRHIKSTEIQTLLVHSTTSHNSQDGFAQLNCDPSALLITHCLPRSTEAGSQNWKWSQNSTPGALSQEAGFHSSTFTSASSIHPLVLVLTVIISPIIIEITVLIQGKETRLLLPLFLEQWCQQHVQYADKCHFCSDGE